MKTGRTIMELAQEVMRREESKRDFIAPVSRLGVVVNDDKDRSMALVVPSQSGANTFPMNTHAHAQIGEYLDIPARHYNRLLGSHPDLLAREVNRFLPAMLERDGATPQQRMIRTVDGRARAFLSNRYRRLDYMDMITAILPIIQSDKSLIVESCEVTETKLYLKVVKPSTEAEIMKGDPVHAGFVVTDSEIGMGSVKCEPFLKRLVCLNGMTVKEFGQRKNHVGRASMADEAFELYSDATLQLDDMSFWAKIADTVRATLDDTKTAMIFGKLRESTTLKIEGNPEAVVTELSRRFAFSDGHRNAILRNLIDGGVGMNQWGLANAITAVANTAEDYDTASALESAGGRLITMPAADWKSLAKAA